MHIRVPSRGADFLAYVDEVDIEVANLSGDHSRYTIRFADEAAESFSFSFENGRISTGLDLDSIDKAQVGSTFLSDLVDAQITATTSTTVSIDAGINLGAGWVVEVRTSDYGWGLANDRNLLGRFTSRTFSVPRLGAVQTYFLRQHDASSPAKYSRYSTALHIDFPL